MGTRRVTRVAGPLAALALLAGVTGAGGPATTMASARDTGSAGAGATPPGRTGAGAASAPSFRAGDPDPEPAVPARRSDAADREAVTVTVYNGNFGLVREVRDVALAEGLVTLEFADVASSIQTETVHIRPLGGSELGVLEQNYRYDLLSPQKLLEKYVGRTVKVYVRDPQTGAEEPVEAEVLSVNNGTVLRIGDEITYDVPGRLAFPELPEDLIAEPTLMWLLESGRRSQRVEASYLTGGLNWKSDYVVVVDEDDERGSMTGWVTLTNQSGATWEDARLKLVAGDVQRVGEGRRRTEMALRAAAVAEDAAGFTEEGFFEYHLYTLGRPTTLRNHEQKQVTLLESDDFGLRKKLAFYGAARYYRGQHGHVVSNQAVDVFLEFENRASDGLGMPLPAGVVRVYKRDGEGAQQFIGEDRIDHTPRDEEVTIRMGEAFDVIGDRRQMDWTALGSCVSESAWRVDLRNHKDEAVEVEVVEPIGGDWTLLSSTHTHRKLDAHTFAFDVRVPARDAVRVEYRVRVRWC